jgi:hypothetical protein
MNNLLSARGGQRGNSVADSLDEAKAAFRGSDSVRATINNAPHKC